MESIAKLPAAAAPAPSIADHSVGERLHKNAPDLFRYDIDLVVPQERGKEGPLVAVGFDQRRLVSCCATVRHFVEASDRNADAAPDPGAGASATHTEQHESSQGPAKPALSMALTMPACHQKSMQGLLSSLVPPGLPAKIPLAELTDMVSAADYFCLDTNHSAVLQDRFRTQLDGASFEELADLLAVSSGPTSAMISDRVLQNIERVTTAELVVKVDKFDLEVLRRVLDLGKFATNEDIVWNLVSWWWARHRCDAWPTLTALQDEDLMTKVRWHALSEQQFVACATHGCFTWEQYDAWMHVRRVLAPLSCKERNGIEVTLQDQVFAPRSRIIDLDERICTKPEQRRVTSQMATLKVSGDRFSITEHDDYVHATW